MEYTKFREITALSCVVVIKLTCFDYILISRLKLGTIIIPLVFLK
jgi:hypothetical protein